MDKSGDFIFITYVLLSVINVRAALHRKWLPFSLSKAILMPVLTGFYAVNSSARSMSVVLALFFAWSGDVLLLIPNKKIVKNLRSAFHSGRNALVAGGIAFSTCHLCYIESFYRLRVPSGELIWYVPVMAIYMLLGIVFYTCLKQHLRGLNSLNQAGMGLYLLVLLMMSFSSTLLINPHYTVSFVPLVGSIFFVFSDYLLAVGYRTHRAFTYRPWAMASYVIAQFLIIAGIILAEA